MCVEAARDRHARRDTDADLNWRERGAVASPLIRDGVVGLGQRLQPNRLIARRFTGRARLAFGVGTNLTNDLGYEALQIVIKMTRCNGQPVAKISDEPSKAMDYDPSYVAYLREVFQVPEPAEESVQG